MFTPRRQSPSDPPRQPPKLIHARPILVVDALSEARDHLTASLTRAGFAVEVVQTLTDAHQRITQARPAALIVADAEVDSADLEWLDRLEETGPHTAVLVLSARPGARHPLSILADGVLATPASAAALVRALRQAGVDPYPEHRVLLVDDDEQTVRLASLILGAHGFRIEAYRSPEAALASAMARRPSAIVLDLLMPEMSGGQFVEMLRRSPHNRTTPIIVWTGKALSDAERSDLRNRVDAVLQKGLGTESLVDELQFQCSREV